MTRVPTVSVLPTRWWVAFGDGESSYAAMPPKLQHRIRSALNAAGFDSTGSKFSSGDYEGMTAFARIQREPDYPPLRWQKEGSVMVKQASSWRSTAPFWYPDVNCQRNAVFGGEILLPMPTRA